MTEPRVIASVTAHATEPEQVYVMRLDFPAPALGANFDSAIDTAIQAASATGMLHDAVRRVVVECEYTDGVDAMAGKGERDV